ncbi:MAG: ankyrin repeat domain-containing protein, partial [Verrucomicrobiae bacterium]|nr:ankyrin repeat domain-containing protein [Verrucomicrobiae bacterium]
AEDSVAKRLLREEIAVAEAQLLDTERQQSVGSASAADVLKARRELLALRRELASLPPTDLVLKSTAGSAPREAAATEDEETREIQRLERMLANSPDLLNASQGPDNKETPLQTAARLDQQRVVEFLLKSGAEIDATGSLEVTAMYLAAKAGHKAMVDLLIRNGANVNARAPYGPTPLLAAVGYDRLAVVSSLLAAGASPNLRGNDWRTSEDFQRPSPFGVAVALARSNLVDQMARKGADLDAVALGDSTPLGIALSRRNWPLAEQLLQLGANPAVTTEVVLKDRRRPSSHIVKGLPIEIAVRLPDAPLALLDRLQPQGSLKELGPDPLLQAINSRTTNAIRWLLDHGVNVNATDADGWTPLLSLMSVLSQIPADEAGQAEALATLELLLQHGADVNRTRKTSHPVVSSMLRPLRPEPTPRPVMPTAVAAEVMPPEEDEGPLQLALASNHTNVFARLLKAGADPKRLLIIYAGWAERRETIPNFRAMLEAGVDANEEWRGYTALDYATLRSPAVVNLLLQFKADPNHRTPEGLSPLDQLRSWKYGAAPGQITTIGNSEEQSRAVEAALRAAGAREDAPDFQGIGLLRLS